MTCRTARSHRPVDRRLMTREVYENLHAPRLSRVATLSARVRWMRSAIFFFTPLYIRDLRSRGTNASFSLSEHNGVKWGRGRERGFVLVIERTTGLSFIGYKYGSGGGGACDVTWLDTSRHGNWLLICVCVCIFWSSYHVLDVRLFCTRSDVDRR